jgi:preprotein translocase subunit YajC
VKKRAAAKRKHETQFKTGDRVRYQDGATGEVTSVTTRVLVVRMSDGTTATLHPLDAVETLEVSRE